MTSDRITVWRAIYKPAEHTLLVTADTTALGGSVILKPLGFKRLKYDSSGDFYQRLYIDVTSDPGSVTVVSNIGGASATVPTVAE